MDVQSLLRPMSRLLSHAPKRCRVLRSTQQCPQPLLARTMATETNLPLDAALEESDASMSIHPGLTTSSTQPRHSYTPTELTTTVYSFPSMEPLRYATFAEYELGLPLRKDILHRAVIYEGDKTRQGTASTKWRNEVHGSGRKLRPQKGLGMARVGNKQSPIRRGGGVAFGPKPRDFSTKLPRKIYDLAWRTALSYRYNQGELLLVETFSELESGESWWIRRIFDELRWGGGYGRSMLVGRPWDDRPNLGMGFSKLGKLGRAVTTDEVDVKNLLSLDRLVMEVGALRRILKSHSSDLAPSETRSVRGGTEPISIHD